VRERGGSPELPPPACRTWLDKFPAERTSPQPSPEASRHLGSSPWARLWRRSAPPFSVPPTSSALHGYRTSLAGRLTVRGEIELPKSAPSTDNVLPRPRWSGWGWPAFNSPNSRYSRRRRTETATSLALGHCGPSALDCPEQVGTTRRGTADSNASTITGSTADSNASTITRVIPKPCSSSAIASHIRDRRTPAFRAPTVVLGIGHQGERLSGRRSMERPDGSRSRSSCTGPALGESPSEQQVTILPRFRKW
jgi:hypothetical protein